MKLSSFSLVILKRVKDSQKTLACHFDSSSPNSQVLVFKLKAVKASAELFIFHTILSYIIYFQFQGLENAKFFQDSH